MRVLLFVIFGVYMSQYTSVPRSNECSQVKRVFPGQTSVPRSNECSQVKRAQVKRVFPGQTSVPRSNECSQVKRVFPGQTSVPRSNEPRSNERSQVKRVFPGQTSVPRSSLNQLWLGFPCLLIMENQKLSLQHKPPVRVQNNIIQTDNTNR